MTERVMAAIEHPLVDCIGHLTGRLIGRREPYEIDVERVVAAAAEPARCSRSTATRTAATSRSATPGWPRMPARISSTPTPTGSTTLENIVYGIATARRAWLTAAEVANTAALAGVRSLRKRA